MAWRTAKALVQLRQQVNLMASERSVISDGTIGNEEHQSRASDHNPWVKDDAVGVVTAIDFTHDPAGGFDSYAFAEGLRINRDIRLKYVISNGRIFSSTESPWRWRKYSGKNDHSSHCHISVKSKKEFYDDERPWSIIMPGAKFSGPALPPAQVLSLGVKGDEVSYLQTLLGVVVDGHFGPDTEKAVMTFQRKNGLVPDGVVGVYTWRQLKKEK